MLPVKPHHLLMTLLIISRVMVAPVWFSLHVAKIPSQQREAAFEQVRMRKRRQSGIPGSAGFITTEAVEAEDADTFRNNILPGFLTICWLTFSRKLVAFVTAPAVFVKRHTTGRLFLLLSDLRV